MYILHICYYIWYIMWNTKATLWVRHEPFLDWTIFIWGVDRDDSQSDSEVTHYWTEMTPSLTLVSLTTGTLIVAVTVPWLERPGLLDSATEGAGSYPPQLSLVRSHTTHQSTHTEISPAPRFSLSGLKGISKPQGPMFCPQICREGDNEILGTGCDKWLRVKTPTHRQQPVSRNGSGKREIFLSVVSFSNFSNGCHPQSGLTAGCNVNF